MRVMAGGAILSIQSAVAYGHVGNSAAVLPLQRLGFEVWPVNTVQFSNHPGYGARTGQVFSGAQVLEVVQGVAALGVLGGCAAVLSGYLGAPDVAGAVAEAVGVVRRANPAAVYCCDPVIGDAGPGIYVDPAIPGLLRERLLPLADMATPNHFELEQLTGCKVRSLAEAKDVAGALVGSMRPGACVLVTSLLANDTPPGQLDVLAVSAAASWRVRTPRLAVAPNGTGDTVAALFLGYWLLSGRVDEALARAAGAIFGLVRRSAEAGTRELLMVAAQEEFVRPSATFPVTRV